MRRRGNALVLGLAFLTSTAASRPEPAVARPPDGSGGVVLQAPYDNCVTKTAHSQSPKPDSPKVLTKGFSVATASCNASSGTIAYRPIVFGGTQGGVNVFSQPTQTADASGKVLGKFRATEAGDWQISAMLRIGGEAGAAAGSGMAASINPADEFGKSLIDYLTDTQFSVFLNLLGAFVSPTAAGSTTYAFVDVEGAGQGSASIQLPGVAASFPIIGPWWADRTYDGTHYIQLATTVHVSKPGVVKVWVGARSHAEAWGYAEAFTKIDTVTVDSIEVSPPNADPPEAPGGLTATWTDWATCTGGPDWSGAPTALDGYDTCYTATYRWDPVTNADGYRIYGAFMNPSYDSCDGLSPLLVTTLPSTATSVNLYIDGERNFGLVCFYISAQNSVGESQIVHLPRRPSS